MITIIRLVLARTLTLLAMGMVVGTTIVFANVFLTQPHSEPGRILFSLGSGKERGISRSLVPSTALFSYPMYLYLQRSINQSIDLAAIQSVDEHWTLSLPSSKAEAAVEANCRYVTSTYFRVLPTDVLFGRTIGAGDELEGKIPAAVASYSFWHGALGGNVKLIGQHVRLGLREVLLVGVLPAGYSGDTLGKTPDLWLPLQAALKPEDNVSPLQSTHSYFLIIIGDTDRSVPMLGLQQHLDAMFRQKAISDTPDQDKAEVSVSIDETHLALTATPRGLPSGEAPLLLIACIIGTMEALLLAGSALAWKDSHSFLLHTRHQPYSNATPLRRIAVVTLAVTGMAGVALFWVQGVLTPALAVGTGLSLPSISGRALAVSLLPLLLGFSLALWHRRLMPAAEMYPNAKRFPLGTGRRLRYGVLVGQVVAAVYALVLSCLYLQREFSLSHTHLGFDVAHLMEMSFGGHRKVFPATDGVGNPCDFAHYELTGVASNAACASFSPWDPKHRLATVHIQGTGPLNSTSDEAMIASVTNTFFDTVDIPLFSGSVNGSRGSTQGAGVAIVSRSFATHRFGNYSPIGSSILVGNDVVPLVIKGVVEDSQLVAVSHEAADQVYTLVPFTSPDLTTLFLHSLKPADHLVLRTKNTGIYVGTATSVNARFLYACEVANPIIRGSLLMAAALVMAAALIGLNLHHDPQGSESNGT